MLLFESVNDPAKAKKIDDLYGFNHSDFIALTAKYDVFSVQLVPSLAAQLEESRQLIQKLMLETEVQKQTLSILNNQIVEIDNSRTWKIVSLIRAAYLDLQKRSFALLKNIFFLKYINNYVQPIRNIYLIRNSVLFNESWYIENNPDVVNSKKDPVTHYINHGGFEGRDPSLEFSSSWYLENYDDVKKAGINPLVHYLKYGEKDGRKITQALKRNTKSSPLAQDSPSPAQTLCQQIHQGDIYEGFAHQDFSLDIRGWNSDDPIFRQLIEELRPRYVVELGTWKGASALHMCGLAKELGLTPFILICVDTWLGGTWPWQNPSSNEYASLGSYHGHPTIYFQFLANVIKTGNTDLIIPFPNTTDVAASYFRSIGLKDIDLIYVDASHTFEAVYTDIRNWWSFLRSGGILFGDDFTPSYPGVEQAVRLFCEENTLTFEIADNKWVVRKP